ncbi:MAG: serine hydrolase domain-containing protein, partial [Saprospiraceae bacterium]|nr:serine hydrolase domain-containing protein [Saprospiraceae bacterium]
MASSTAPGQTPTTEHLRREIDKIIRFDTEIDYRKTPGFIVGILDGDSTYILPFGVRVPGTDDAITADDRFEIGGLTKVFTHLLLLKLDQRGILALDSVVNHLLPPTCSNPALAGLTIRSLLNHTSGIPKYPPMFGDAQEATQNPYGSFDEAKLLTAYQQLVPRDIGEFRYSHFNYALAEPILHYGLGLDYATLLKRELLAPLNMTRTSLDTVNLAPGYALSGRQVQPWTFSSFA